MKHRTKRADQYRSLQDALRCDLDQYEARTGYNPVRKLTALSGIPASSIYQMAEGRMAISMELAQAVVTLLGEMELARAYGRNCRLLLTPIPCGCDLDATGIPQGIQDFAAAAQSIVEALEDGVIEEHEYQRIQRCFYELMLWCQAMQDEAKARMQQGRNVTPYVPKSLAEAERRRGG